MAYNLPTITRLAGSVTTLYVELLQQVQTSELENHITQTPDSFVSKTIKGQIYWYWQIYSPEGTKKQIYLGAETATLRIFLQKWRADSLSLKILLHSICQKP